MTDIKEKKNKFKFYYKATSLAVIVIQVLILLFMAIKGRSEQFDSTYKLFVIFAYADIIAMAIVEIIDDLASGNGVFIINYLYSRIKYKNQIIDIGLARLKQRYNGTALGWMWAVIRPTLTIFVFWFGIEMGLRSGGKVGEYPYFLWLIAGFVPWFYMSDMITYGAGCIRNNQYLLKVGDFPVITIPTITGVSLFPVHLVMVLTTILIFLAFGFHLDFYLLQLPLYMLMMFVLFDFWSLFAGTLSTISRDFQNLVNSILTPLFWLSGIIYNVEGMKNIWIRTILELNPITVIVTGYRHCFIDKVWFFQRPVEMVNFGILLGIMIILAAKADKKFGKILPDML